MKNPVTLTDGAGIASGHLEMNEQLDRIEKTLAKIDVVQEQIIVELDTLLARAGKQIVVEGTGEINPDEELWPVWYSIAYSVPGWTVLLDTADAWMKEARIPEDLAERKAYALRDWFADGKKKRDPYKSWQNWCRQDRDKALKNPANVNDKSRYEAAYDAQREP